MLQGTHPDTTSASQRLLSIAAKWDPIPRFQWGVFLTWNFIPLWNCWSPVLRSARAGADAADITDGSRNARRGSPGAAQRHPGVCGQGAPWTPQAACLATAQCQQGGWVSVIRWPPRSRWPLLICSSAVIRRDSETVLCIPNAYLIGVCLNNV